jgi:predicted transcriptional regulator of viral defense system
VLLALSELEARGFLGRGDNGRYVVLAAGEV